MPKYSLDNLRKPGRPKGTTGPNKPAIAKKRAGSWTERKKPAPPPIKIKKLKPRPIRGLKRLCQTKIPGYDPWRDAGDCHFDQKAARHAIEWIEGELSHVKGAKAREPFLLEDWQRAIIATLFGWKRPDGTRRYRYAFVFVPRKNGKTALAACIILYCLFEDGEAGAEIYGAASEYRQASKVWEHAAGMVRQNPKLLEKAQIFRGQAKAIQRRDDFSTYAVLASSPEALSHHGGNTHVFVVDELHALSDNEMVDVLETSTGSRRQPLGVYITTSDYEREGSPCNEKHDYAGKVRDGIIRDAAFLPVIYEAARKDDWSKPAVWRRCNPNFGVSVYEEYIVASYAKARELPRFENTFKRLHLNIRTEQAMRWLPVGCLRRRAVEAGRLRGAAMLGWPRPRHDAGYDGLGSGVPAGGRDDRPDPDLLDTAGKCDCPRAPRPGAVSDLDQAGLDSGDRGRYVGPGGDPAGHQRTD